MAQQPVTPNKRPLTDLPDYLRANGLRVTGIHWPFRMGDGVTFDYAAIETPISDRKEESKNE